ncbi:ABC transporter ATP-binding protein [Clostridium kluyveri]|uniref:Multidrug ABC transporter permease n=1 Tax=Clostridium kluyveri TaxID=1534 RepID=A0A1L5F9S1_CLOKL|nr:ABC transporter ATP-binding protein [Clostridium kluyveri]APM39717.1 multidrug ABC transporter permease [Clostridium kluyveri]UZQ50121.1 ABC transporter ATP-binding protein/permease [Clostridium kluyveri]
MKKDSTFRRLMYFASQCKDKMTVSVILAVLGVACGMIPYFAAANITVKIIDGNSDFRQLSYVVLAALAGYTGKVGFNALSTSISHSAAFTILKNIRVKFAEKLSKVPLGYVLENPSGELKTIMVDTVEKLEEPLAHVIPEMTSNLLVPIFVLLYLFYLDWRMALISLVTIPIGMLLYKPIMKKYVYYYKKYVQAGNLMNSNVVEYVNGIEAIKAFNQSSTSYKKYSDSVENNCAAVTAFFKNTLFLYTAVMYVTPEALLFVIPSGLYFYINGTLALSVFITCIILCFGLLTPLVQAMQYTDSIASMGTIIGQVYQILDKEELKRPSQYKKLKNYKIKFQDVTFSYDDTEILKGISFDIVPRGMTAIVGPSGSGKSTIAKLIASFWEASGGRITIDDVDVRDIPLKQISDVISYVSQENFLFNTSIKENIRIGKEGASDKEIIEAAKKASCHDFIMCLQNGYETEAGEAGKHFSGGERQRISIARAILKNSPVIVLDEATAYADPENEAIIQESISQMVKGKTLIVIAHRLSTITTADNIVVVNQGKIEAQGTHEKLLENCNLYRKMWEAHIGTKDRDEIKGGKKYA